MLETKGLRYKMVEFFFFYVYMQTVKQSFQKIFSHTWNFYFLLLIDSLIIINNQIHVKISQINRLISYHLKISFQSEAIS